MTMPSIERLGHVGISIRESVCEHGATGYVDPKFLELQNISATQ
jgi:hypothetical protein